MISLLSACVSLHTPWGVFLTETQWVSHIQLSCVGVIYFVKTAQYLNFACFPFLFYYSKMDILDNMCVRWLLHPNHTMHIMFFPPNSNISGQETTWFYFHVHVILTNSKTDTETEDTVFIHRRQKCRKKAVSAQHYNKVCNLSLEFMFLCKKTIKFYLDLGFFWFIMAQLAHRW